MRIDLVPAVPIRGSGKITIVSPVFPLTIGNLDGGASQTIHLILKVPGTVKQFALAEAGDFTNVKGTHSLFAQLQTVSF